MLNRRLQFMSFAKFHFISALHGTGVGHLFDSVDKAYASAMRDLSTADVAKALEIAVTNHPPPLVRGRRIKLRYAHCGGHNPPIIVVHGNQLNELPNSYKRYLNNFFRTHFGFSGTPIRVEFKSGSNPFAGRRNKLTPRQEHKRKRLMKFAKKKK